MNKDQEIGVLILTTSIIGIIIYTWLLFTYAVLVLQITAFISVAFVLVIAAWIGWTMATTPPPAPLEAEPAVMQSTSGTANPEE